jgi:hypothetical protein
MNTTPPDLPPPLPQPRTSTGFVTVISWIAFALALLGVFYSLAKIISGLFMPKDLLLRTMNPTGQPLSLPPMLDWFTTHRLMVGIVELLLSLLLAWVAWNLRKRRNWARMAFIAFLLFGMIWQFAGLWMMPQTIEYTMNMQAAMLPPDQAMQDGMKNFMRMAMLVGGMFNLAIATLLGWLAWKFFSRKLRVQFAD